MSECLADTVINRHKRRKKKVRLITIDLDPTADPTHGNQQLSLFNRFYDSHCYVPLTGFLTFDAEPEQYLFCYMLRPGNAPARQGCLNMLKRLLPRLRTAFPAENRIRELKDGLEIDRTSCSRFLANQLRVLITAAAYVLFQELRLKARHTRFGRAQVATLRLHLLKFGAWVESSVRRVVLHLPLDAPFANEWLRIARSIGAVPT